MPLPSLDTFVGTASEAKPSLDSFVGSTATPAVNQPSTLQKVGNVVNSIFPGKQVGQAIGTLAGYGVSKAQGTSDQYDLSAPSPLQVGGDIAQGALTVAAPGIGSEGGTLAKIGANAALGAGIGGTNAIAQGKGLGDVAKSTAVGGVAGGAISAATEGLTSVAENLPTWFTKAALPKLKEGNVDYALANTPLGSTKTMLEASNASRAGYESQIKEILTHPEYATETGNVSNAIPSISQQFPNAQLEQPKIISILKQVAPANKSLVDKVVDGTANLDEQNLLRKELDFATKKAYTDSPALTFNKQIGKTMADFLRGNVQETAPETAPIFQKYSKELNLNAVLSKISAKNNLKPTWKDIAAGYEGYKIDGIQGALTGIAGERLLGSTGGLMGLAKAAKPISEAAPILNTLSKGVKAPLIKSTTQ